jgi:glucose-6-phosphate isomerase
VIDIKMKRRRIMTISFDYSNALPFMKKSEINHLSEFVKTVHNMLHEKKGPGSDSRMG